MSKHHQPIHINKKVRQWTLYYNDDPVKGAIRVPYPIARGKEKELLETKNYLLLKFQIKPYIEKYK